MKKSVENVIITASTTMSGVVITQTANAMGVPLSIMTHATTSKIDLIQGFQSF